MTSRTDAGAAMPGPPRKWQVEIKSPGGAVRETVLSDGPAAWHAIRATLDNGIPNEDLDIIVRQVSGATG